jgi:hypothetical protein
VWLKERALLEDLGTTTVAHLERFTKATDCPDGRKRFRAVAVISATLVDDELADAPSGDGAPSLPEDSPVPDAGRAMGDNGDRRW